MTVAGWTSAALAIGWLGVAVAGLAMPGGHPPAAFVMGEGVVMVSYLIAPLGVGAASLDLWRARHRGVRAPRAAGLLAVNALLLLVALALGWWILWEAARR